MSCEANSSSNSLSAQAVVTRRGEPHDDAAATSNRNLVRIELIRQETGRTSSQACTDLRADADVQSTVLFSAEYPIHEFNYVQGRYFVRVSECSDPNDASCVVKFCSKPKRLVPTTELGEDGECSDEDQQPAFVDADLVEDEGRGGALLSLDECNVKVTAVVPLCTAYQSYHTATITPVKVEDDGVGSHGSVPG